MKVGSVIAIVLTFVTPQLRELAVQFLVNGNINDVTFFMVLFFLSPCSRHASVCTSFDMLGNVIL